jgi:hypothetical protein
MKARLFLSLLWVPLVTIPLAAQDTLYPVQTGVSLGSVRVEASPYQDNRYSYVAQKGIEYTLTLGFPRDDQAEFIQNTGANVAVLWLTIENQSRQPILVDTSKFTAADKAGHAYSGLAAAEAFDRIVTEKGRTLKAVNRGIRSVTLGKAAGKTSVDEARDEAVRFAFPKGPVPALSTVQGLIYFESPDKKTFTLNISLGDLWPKPFAFTNVKPKK